MALTVVIRDGSSPDQGGAPTLSFDAPRVVIGRADGCEVRLPDPSVSARHATLRQHGGTYLLLDEGSSNGTFVGGVRLAAHAPRVVTHGDLVRVGRVWLELRLEAVAQPSTPVATRELALSLVQKALASAGEQATPQLRGVAGPDEGKTMALDRGGVALIIGRGNGVDLQLDETDASRRHVQVTRRGDQLFVRDLGSKNGSHLNGARLDPDRDTLMRVGDELCVGADVFVYENPALVALAEIERGADEVLAEGEVVPAPEAPDEASSPEESEPPPRVDAPAAPVVAPPRKLARAEPRSTGWGTSDIMIVVLALGVLALSAVGLYFLFGA